MAALSWPLRSSRPPPSPTSPTLFEITVRSFVSVSASACKRCTGAPVMPKPPTMRRLPEAMVATASSGVSRGRVRMA